MLQRPVCSDPKFEEEMERAGTDLGYELISIATAKAANPDELTANILTLEHTLIAGVALLLLNTVKQGRGTKEEFMEWFHKELEIKYLSAEVDKTLVPREAGGKEVIFN